ncbi:MAG: hypothetical protein ABFC62_12635 [Clostridiaceae bacterium]|nr:hypothetical protein [Eubacteriales bacterium]
MAYEYYLFAGFVFLLLAAVLYLNHMFKRSRSEGDSRDDRERRLYALYQNLDEEMLAFDDDVKRAREEADEKLSRMEGLLQRMEGMSAALSAEIGRVRAELSTLNAPEARAEAVKAEPPKREVKRADEKRAVRRRSPRAEQVRKMREEGMETDEIARTLAISRGEVELILGIGK